jgi:hypothetical protein
MDIPFGSREIGLIGRDLGKSYTDTLFDPKDPIGMLGDRLKDKALDYQIPSTGNEVVDTLIKALDPRNPVKLASEAGKVATRNGNRAVKYVKGLLS